MRNMSTVPYGFGRRLTAALIVAEKTQVQFAAELGVSVATINRICSQGHTPNETLAILMSQKLGVKRWAYCMAESDVLPPGRS